MTKAAALQVHRALCVYVHHLYTTTTWNDQILLSSLENVNGKAINFIVSVWARMQSPPSPSTFRPCVNETPFRDVHEAAISLQVCSWCCAKLESSPGIESPQLKKGHVPLWNTPAPPPPPLQSPSRPALHLPPGFIQPSAIGTLSNKNVDVQDIKNGNRKWIFSVFQCSDSSNSYGGR